MEETNDELLGTFEALGGDIVGGMGRERGGGVGVVDDRRVCSNLFGLWNSRKTIRVFKFKGVTSNS